MEPHSAERVRHLISALSDGAVKAAVAAAASVVLIASLLYFTTGSIHEISRKYSGDLPNRLGSAEFWDMITDFSESGGYFRSDNFLSNETGFQEVIPELRKVIGPGGVYMGVGPEQNFTYLAALHPRMAFIIDIRRQNMLEHLLYKAFLEMASDRADFLSLLFARPRPAGLGSGSTADALFTAFDFAVPDRDLFEQNLNMAMDHLAIDGIPQTFLSIDDRKGMRKVYGAFFDSGPDLSYTFDGAPIRGGRGVMPSYSTLMTATDGEGMNWSYLATEDQFESVRQMERNNLIVPLVGNFAGDKAIRSVGQYLKDHHASVTTFYVSNVEQYLFQQENDWRRFYSNVSELPVDSSGMFIRSIVNGRGGFSRNTSYRSILRSATSSLSGLVRAFEADQIHAYYDVVGSSSPAN